MTDLHRARILLAEDDAAMRTSLERALHNAGFAVDSVDRIVTTYQEGPSIGSIELVRVMVEPIAAVMKA